MTLTAQELDELPTGTQVIDRDGDTYTKHENGRWGGAWGLNSSAFVASYDAQVDLFQQARIALRDRLGTEPTQELVEATSRLIGTRRIMRPGLMNAKQAARVAVEVMSMSATSEQQTDATSVVAPADADFAVVVFVKDNDTAGLARLRAHAALDALLDQHGISR